MRNFDLTPLYRSAVGYDRFGSLLEEAARVDQQPSYPPYNIELVDENSYRITMAVAGFSDQEIDIEAKGDSLLISGKKTDVEEDKSRFLHRGIATRNFERRFRIAEHVRVEGAALENGLLSIQLVREIPEALKPRKIAINGAKPVLETAA